MNNVGQLQDNSRGQSKNTGELGVQTHVFHPGGHPTTILTTDPPEGPVVRGCNINSSYDIEPAPFSHRLETFSVQTTTGCPHPDNPFPQANHVTWEANSLMLFAPWSPRLNPTLAPPKCCTVLCPPWPKRMAVLTSLAFSSLFQFPWPVSGNVSGCLCQVFRCFSSSFAIFFRPLFGERGDIRSALLEAASTLWRRRWRPCGPGRPTP